MFYIMMIISNEKPTNSSKDLQNNVLYKRFGTFMVENRSILRSSQYFSFLNIMFL